MTDETPVVDPENGEQEQDAQTPEPKVFDAEYVKGLRNEAAKYRIKARDLEQKQKEAEDARLAKDNEWEELAGQRATEIEELTPYRQKYNTMLESVAESNTKRIEAVPENMRSLVPEFEDPLKTAAWLDANSQMLTKPLAPTVNGNAGSAERPGESDTLSAEELAAATKMGITAKEYQDAKR